MRILTAEAMGKVDRAAIEEIGIPGMVLMENAAIGLADAVEREFPDADPVAVLCGPGNNGGDGLALGRQLTARGRRALLFLVAGGREPGGDAGTQLAICRAMELPVTTVEGESDLPAVLAACRRSGLVVDALFGTGLSRPLEGLFARLVEELGALDVPLLAVDLPSGLNGSRAEIFGPHLKADLTVTFAAPKVAHIFPPTADAMGEVVVADLGIPPHLVAEVEEEGGGSLHLLLSEELAPYLAPRRPDSHKGDYGHLLVVAGAPGKAGAGILAGRAAVRSGAGLVTLAVPEPILTAVDVGSLESMSLPLPALAGGGLAAAAAEAALAAAAERDALAVGPGLGQAEETVAAVRRLVLESEVPLVLDADGVNAFAGRAGELARRRGPAVLTPHPGELGRLLGVPTAEVQRDRRAAARRAAGETGAVVVLKGHLSLVATPGGEVHANATGNAGMASGGSGDVLTGMIGALLAQGYEPLAAAQLGVHLHGLAGDLAARDRGEISLAAADLVEALPDAFRRLREAG